MISLLIVDDEEDIRKGIRTMIDWVSNGINVCGEAEDGAEALQMIQELNPDILLMDIRMPEMDGLQVIQTVYSHPNPAKSIILSGYDDFTYAQMALKFGASSYLLKPCLPEEILETVLKLKAEIQSERAKKQIFEHLKIKFNENLPVLKENYLVKLIHNEKKPSEHILENFELFGIRLKMSHVTVSILRIDDYAALSNQYDHNEIELMRFAVKNIVDEMMSARFICEVFEDKGDILILSSVDIDQSNSGFLDLLAEVNQHIQNILGFTVSIGVGSTYEDLNGIHRSYKEALKSIEARFLVGTASIIRYEDINYGDIEDNEYPLSEEKNILSCIKTGKSEELDRRLEEFFQALNSDAYAKEHILKLCLALILSLYHLCVETNVNTDEIFGVGLTAIDDILKVDTPSQIKQKLVQISHTILGKIQNRKSSNKIIELSLKYIEENYHKDLNLDSVANSVYINSGYFCILFKKTMGTNFIEYLHKKRIEKACEILTDIHSKSYEVALKVGYSNEKYFYQIFKKHTGMTPTQYKESINI
jgi:two-component system response regulator YesN